MICVAKTDKKTMIAKSIKKYIEFLTNVNQNRCVINLDRYCICTYSCGFVCVFESNIYNLKKIEPQRLYYRKVAVLGGFKHNSLIPFCPISFSNLIFDTVVSRGLPHKSLIALLLYFM